MYLNRKGKFMIAIHFGVDCMPKWADFVKKSSKTSWFQQKPCQIQLIRANCQKWLISGTSRDNKSAVQLHDNEKLRRGFGHWLWDKGFHLSLQHNSIGCNLCKRGHYMCIRFGKKKSILQSHMHDVFSLYGSKTWLVEKKDPSKRKPKSNENKTNNILNLFQLHIHSPAGTTTGRRPEMVWVHRTLLGMKFV